jgi:hypothetical protein
VYAVLHNPAYRKKYELNLKRDFPRIPFYKDFWQWAAWGKKLMDLHIGYETVEPYPLKEHNYEVKAEARRQKEMFTVAQEPEPMFGIKPKVKTKLRADKQAGIIEIDELTFLSGVPNSAWEYKLGNRSALEWILDQYKEKKPKDPTIAEKFNTYRFADYKEKVIDLLKRVCTVSVETVRVVGEMEIAQGNRIHFLTPEGHGMYSDVGYVKENEQVVFLHIGEMKNFKELPAMKKQRGGHAAANHTWCCLPKRASCCGWKWIVTHNTSTQ